MQDSLKSKLYDALKARYPGYLTINEVEAICKAHKNKISNGERRLRQSESPRVSRIKNSKGAIIGYKWIEGVQRPIQYRTPKETLTDGLNDDIMNILMNTPVTWNEQQKIAELNKALKSDYNETKEAVLKKYRQI
jgi:hypothetical protein